MTKFIPSVGKALIRRKKTEDLRESAIVLTDQANDQDSEYGEIVFVNYNKEIMESGLLDHQEEIFDNLCKRARNGEIGVSEEIERMNALLDKITYRVGDLVIVSQYSGTVVIDKDTTERMTLIDLNSILCKAVSNE